MSGEVYDVSFDHSAVKPAQLVAVGAAGVIGYVGSDPRKCITRPEVDAFNAAGLAVATVHENTTSWRTWNGAAANRACDALGQPADRPIYYADDESETPGAHPAIAAALAAQPGPRPKGFYGPAAAVEYMLEHGAATHGWLTSATSWDPGPAPLACLRQLYAGQEHTPHGIVQRPTIPGTDTNIVLLPDWGQWPLTSSPGGDDDMAIAPVIFQLSDNGDLVVIPGTGAQPWIGKSGDAALISVFVFRSLDPDPSRRWPFPNPIPVLSDAHQIAEIRGWLETSAGGASPAAVAAATMDALRAAIAQ